MHVISRYIPTSMLMSTRWRRQYQSPQLSPPCIFSVSTLVSATSLFNSWLRLRPRLRAVFTTGLGFGFLSSSWLRLRHRSHEPGFVLNPTCCHSSGLHKSQATLSPHRHCTVSYQVFPVAASLQLFRWGDFPNRPRRDCSDSPRLSAGSHGLPWAPGSSRQWRRQRRWRRGGGGGGDAIW